MNFLTDNLCKVVICLNHSKRIRIKLSSFQCKTMKLGKSLSLFKLLNLLELWTTAIPLSKQTPAIISWRNLTSPDFQIRSWLCSPIHTDSLRKRRMRTTIKKTSQSNLPTQSFRKRSSDLVKHHLMPLWPKYSTNKLSTSNPKQT